MGETKRRWRDGTGGSRLTERDLEIVSWLDRLGRGSVDQIRRRFGLGRTQGYRRLQVLEGFGLVRRVDLLVRLPALYVSTRRSVRAWNFEHTLLLTDLIVDLELAGRVVRGELEVRRERFGAGSMETWLNAEQMSVLVGCERTPDAIEVCPNGELAAYEIELASKGRARRESILVRYALSDYERVEWIVPGRQLARLLTNDIREMGLDRIMRVTPGSRVPLQTSFETATPSAVEEAIR